MGEREVAYQECSVPEAPDLRRDPILEKLGFLESALANIECRLRQVADGLLGSCPVSDEAKKGFEGGLLDEVDFRLAGLLERSDELRKQLERLEEI